MQTLSEFATQERILYFIAKERIKHCKRNGSRKHPTPDKMADILPPRHSWVHSGHRKAYKQKNGTPDTKRAILHDLIKTIKRDQALQAAGTKQFPYLNRLQDYIAHLQSQLHSGIISLHTPTTQPKFKKWKEVNGQKIRISRPLTIFTDLDDKIILSLTARYMAQVLNSQLHTHILSYRVARPFMGNKHHVTDYNDGILLINEFRAAHPNEDIYVADCDIKKFFDYLSHEVVLRCVKDTLAGAGVPDEAQRQVMAVVEAYLRAFNFHDQVLMSHRPEMVVYEQLEEIDAHQRGIPQGGALSNILANVVLNHVDRSVLENGNGRGDNYLYLRFCDDMILLHTDSDQCQDMMHQYESALQSHQLVYHNFQHVREQKEGAKTLPGFWEQKSHYPYRWGAGEGDSNAFVGFLGYEMNREGKVRLRSSNLQKYEQKLRSTFFAIHRMYKHNRKTPAQMESILNRKMERLDRILLYYTSLQSLPPEPKQAIIRCQKYNRMKRRLRIFLKTRGVKM